MERTHSGLVCRLIAPKSRMFQPRLHLGNTNVQVEISDELGDRGGPVFLPVSATSKQKWMSIMSKWDIYRCRHGLSNIPIHEALHTVLSYDP